MGAYNVQVKAVKADSGMFDEAYTEFRTWRKQVK